jgi:hypothetical protein
MSEYKTNHNHNEPGISRSGGIIHPSPPRPPMTTNVTLAQPPTTNGNNVAACFYVDTGNLLNCSVNSQFFLQKCLSKDPLHFREYYIYRISVSKIATERVF